MDTFMPVYAPHKSSIKNIDANTLSVLIYLGVLLLSIIPYAQYVVWIIPIFFLFAEKDSELVQHSAAQCLVIYLLPNFVSIIVTFFATIFSTASSGVVTAFTNFTTAPLPSLVYIFMFLVSASLSIFAAKKANEYIAYRYKFLNKFVDKLLNL